MADKIVVAVLMFLFTICLVICGIIEGILRSLFFVIEFIFKGKSEIFDEYFCYELLFDK